MKIRYSYALNIIKRPFKGNVLSICKFGDTCCIILNSLLIRRSFSIHEQSFCCNLTDIMYTHVLWCAGAETSLTVTCTFIAPLAARRIRRNAVTASVWKSPFYPTFQHSFTVSNTVSQITSYTVSFYIQVSLIVLTLSADISILINILYSSHKCVE